MEALLLIAGFLVGISSLAGGLKLGAWRARWRKQRDAEHEDRLRRAGWTPPNFSVVGSPFPDDWGWVEPTHADPAVRNRGDHGFGF